MDSFKKASYDQLERVLNIIDKLKPVEKPGTGIPSLDFLERWIENCLVPDDQAVPMSTESTIIMWEKAEPRRDE